MLARSDQTFYPDGTFETSNLLDATLIVPSVSLANLPQLAVDLIISSLNLKRVGWIGLGDTVAPFAGAGDQEEFLTGGMELYGSVERNFFVIQQRSPTLKERKDDHIALLRSFIQSQAFGFVLVLTSLDAANQDDAQLLTPHQCVIPPSTASELSPSGALERLRALPPLSLSLASDPHAAERESASAKAKQYPPFMPSAGLTRRVLASLQETRVPHGCLTAWCVEGDNRADAFGLTARVLQLLAIGDIDLVEPPSWRGLFGGAEGWSGGLGDDSEIYG